MAKNQNIIKEKIHCPYCNKLRIKKYISTHIKNKHSKSQYSQIVRKGMRYNLKNKDLIFKSNTKYYCEICRTTIKIKSSYMHLKSILHKKLLSSLIEQRKVNAQNDVNNTKIGINDNEKKRNIKQNEIIKENYFVEYSKVNVDIFNEKNSDVNSENEESHKKKTNNIIKLKLKTETVENKDKYSVSNLSLPILSESLLSKESCCSKIKYARITEGFIPKCFEIHRIPIFDEKQKVYNENLSKFDSISKSEGFDSYSSSEKILSEKRRYSEDCICDPDERGIKEEVDDIVKKIMKGKKNGNCLKKK